MTHGGFSLRARGPAGGKAARRKLVRTMTGLVGVASMLGASVALSVSLMPAGATIPSSDVVTGTIPTDDFPLQTILNASGTTAYAVNQGSATITVINTVGNTVKMVINTGAEVSSVALNPAGTVIYAANFDDPALTAYDTSTGAEVAEIAVPEPVPAPVRYLDQVAVNPAGTLVYATNYGSNSVNVFSTATNTLLTTIPVGQTPQGVTFNPSGTEAYVANDDNTGTISVIDVATSTVTSTISTAENPFELTFNPAGTALWAVGGIQAQEINPSTGAILATYSKATTGDQNFSQEPDAIAFDPTGTYAYVTEVEGDAQYSGSMTVIDLATKSITQDVSGLSNAAGIVMLPGGKTAYVSNSLGTNLFVLALQQKSTMTAATARLGIVGKKYGATLAATLSGPEGAVQGETVVFRDGKTTTTGTAACSAVTNAQGVASCFASGLGVQLHSGYSAVFSPDGIYLGSAASGKD
jgi:YVTN family beta-propeller protein